MIPTSAHSGDGMGSLIGTIIEMCQTTLAKRLSYTDELQATVMEVSWSSSFVKRGERYSSFDPVRSVQVKAIGGLGTTIDVVLVNGRLRSSDTIIVAGTDAPIVTQIRGLLMPEPNKELRVRVCDPSR